MPPPSSVNIRAFAHGVVLMVRSCDLEGADEVLLLASNREPVTSWAFAVEVSGMTIETRVCTRFGFSGRADRRAETVLEGCGAAPSSGVTTSVIFLRVGERKSKWMRFSK